MGITKYQYNKYVMKYTSFLLVGLMLLLCPGVTYGQTNASANPPQQSLNIVSSPELHSLAENWASEYSRLNPDLNIKLLNKETASPVDGTTIRISGDPAGDGQWKMVVGHDVVVAVFNPDSPMLNEIINQGISANGFTQIFRASEKPEWDALISGGKKTAIKYYFIDDESVIKSIGNFSKTGRELIGGIRITGVKDFIAAIQKDRYSIGFCKLSDMYNENSGEMAENIKLLPIDKNGNRRIDYFEDIYKTPAELLRGVWIGKYPDELSGSIYVTSGIKPTDESILSFLSWALTDGGTFLNRYGYSELAGIEKEAALSSLKPFYSSAKGEAPEASLSWLVILTGILIIGIFTFTIKTVRSKKPAFYEGDIKIVPALDENVIAAPRGLFFDKTHTWAFMEKDGKVRIGVDDFLQHLTGKLTGVRMKEAGEQVVKGEKIFTIIHDGKHLDIHSPVTGIIKERNTALLIDSSLINNSPYSEGWVYMIEPRNWLRETEFLFMSEKYREWLRAEFMRLKDFIAIAVRSNTLAYEHVILQDGGQITDNVLADLGPEIWEDFQTKFIDTAR